ncbi:unnamed protein product [Schistosoma margrebowiei]|uniref:Uncharacterized protein n=1 Tax=Schistosoma margrebowiei TaxID=48269 RepID=A0A183M867_9TREM|nr:unnamed protein product [Schistosoma margrebowiei]
MALYNLHPHVHLVHKLLKIQYVDLLTQLAYVLELIEQM